MSGRGARSMVGIITALAVLVLSFGFAGSAHAEGSPWVQSDLPDYAPGSTVTLTAGGFEPAEAVHVVVNDDQGRSWSYAADVTADEGGGFSHGFKLPDWFVATYAVTATAASGTAHTSFTDGNITLSIAPSGVTASVRVEKFNKNDACAGTPNSDATAIYGSGSSNVGGGAGSVRLTANGADVSGARPFVRWTYDGASVTTRDICLKAPGGINIDAVATYGAAVPSNVAPVAAGDAYAVDEDTTLDVTAPGVLGNDTDADADALTAVLVAGPVHGSLALDAGGSFTYSPDANYQGPDSFTYRADDGTASSSVATVALTVNPINDAPTLDAIADVTVAEDSGAASMGLTGISAPGFEPGQGLTVTAASSNTALLDDPTVAYASPGATGSLSFTPKADQSGTATVTVTVTDNGGTANGGSSSTQRTFQITVTAVNDAPVAVDDSATTAEDTSVVVDVLANDGDVDGDSLSVVPGSLVGTNGTATVIASGSDAGKVRFTPDAEYGGPAGFTYRATDGSAQSNTATVAVTVDPVNDAPVAVDDETTVDEDGSVGVDVLANDSDAEDDALEVTDAGPAGHGTVGIDADGTVTYTPNPDFNGTDSFGYTVSDGNTTDTATVSVTVTAVNDAPVADYDAASTDEDSPVTIDVLSGDADVDGDTLLVVSATGGVNGTTSVNPDGTVTYSPAANFNGTDSFTYTVVDGLGGQATATVTVTVAAVNDAPLAVDDEAAVDEDGSVVVDVLANDSDVDGDPLTVDGAGQGEHGSTVVGADGSVTYTPEANFNGTDSFGYTIDDGNGGTDTATVLVTVNAVNDVPTAEDQAVTTDEDTPVDVTIAGADIDGDELLFSVTGLPQHGTLHDGSHVITAGDLVAGFGSYDTENPVTYVPMSNFHGADSFAFRSSDGTVSSEEATVSLTVMPVNDAPVAEDDSATTAEDAAAGGNALANDGDVDTEDSLAAALATQASHGTATVEANGAWEYTPDTDFVGTDSFTYTVCDDHASTPGDATDQLCDTGTVTVTVTPVNDAPTLDAVGDAAVAEDSGSTTVDLAGITAGPANESGQALTVTAVSDNTALLEHPTVIYTSPEEAGSLSFTPKPDQYGTAHVTVTVSDDGGTADGGLDTTVRTFAITVTPVNDAPVAADDAATTAEDTAVAVDVLDNDTDVDGDDLSVAGASGGSHGSTVVNPDGTVTYTPEADFFGTDSFTYQVCDDHATTPADDQLCHTGTVSVTVTPVNDAPVAADDAATTAEDTAVAVDVLDNDTDVDGDALSVAGASGGSHGSTVVTPDGTVTYTPEADYFGPDSFTYQVCDDHRTTEGDDQLCDTGTVDIMVTPVNDAPVVTGGADRTTTEGAAVTVDATFVDVDREAGEVYTATVDWGDGSPVESATVSGSSVSASHTYADDENPGDDVYHATITVTDAGTTDGAAHPLAGSDTVDVGVSNVAPSVEAPTVAIDPVTGVASLATRFSDPAGSHDAPYTGSFTVDGEALRGTVSGTAMTASMKLAPGCHTFGTTASVTDDDGGTGTSGTTATSGADVYAASFQAPIKDNVRNIAKYGNVVPVKVQLASSCSAGTNVTDVPLYLTIAQGGDAILDDSVGDSSVVVQSVSNADSGTRMRVAGDGYIYNLATKGTGWVPGNDYTLRVRAGSAGGPIILRALFQPKK